VNLRRKADSLLTYMLQTDWPKMAKRWFLYARRWTGRDLPRLLRRVDVRKPMHALVIGVLVAGILAPVLDHLAQEARYRLDREQASVIAHPSAKFTDRLEYDKAAKANIFNKDFQVDQTEGLHSTTGTRKDGKDLYTAKMPVRSGQGIKITENKSQTSVTMLPQFAAMDGRIVDGHVTYPLKDQPGQLILTPKGNGLKEDILLDHAVGDRAQYDYQLDVPDSLKAKLMDDGGVGFYGGDPALFGNISYGSDKDRESVEKARANAEKTYLMFEIPAPVVKQSKGGSSEVNARFELDGKLLSVITTGLAKASYPLSIDPTFVITTASEFNLGAVEDNIDLATAGQIGRAAITGGTVPTWTAGTSMPANDFNFGMTAYNNYLYVVGGGNQASNQVYYTAINSDGSLGTWASTTLFSQSRTGSGVVGWNGYVYIIGGEDGTGSNPQLSTVEYSRVNSDGTLGTWAFTTSMTAVRGYLGATVYKGVLYAGGGQGTKNNGTLRNSVEYAVINSDGTLGTWATTTSFATARDHMGFLAYNGYVYMTGGYTGSAQSDVQYAPIKSDGTLGSWVTNSEAMTGGRRSHALAVERGYLYSYSGCNGGFPCGTYLATGEYAPVNADGSVGKWKATTSISTGRTAAGGASNNGYLYVVGGCTSENGASGNCGTQIADSQYVAVDSIGGVTAPAATSSSLVATKAGVASVAYNGYLYAAGGCNGTNCGTAATTVDYAVLNDDGTVGTWTAGGALNNARFGGVLLGLGGKLWYIGGEGSGGTAGQKTVHSATLSSGSPTWTDLSASSANNSLVTGRYWLSGSVYQNYIYVSGGTGTSGPFNTTEYAQIVNGTLTAPANCVSNGGTLSNSGTGKWCQSGNIFATVSGTSARYGHGTVAYGGYLYIVAGINSGTLLNDVQRSTLASADGYPGTFADTSQTALPASGTDTNIGHAFIAATAHNSVLYIYGGIRNGTNTSSAVTYGKIDSSGNVTSWTRSGNTLVTARWGSGGAAFNGHLYTAGGCSSNSLTCSGYLSSAEYFRVNNGGTGMTSQVNASDWTNQASPAVTNRADAQSVAYNGYLYILGGCTQYSNTPPVECSIWDGSIYYSQISETGAPGTWTANGSNLLTAKSAGGAVAYNGKIYVVSGSVSGNTDDTSVEQWTVSAANGSLSGGTTVTAMAAGRHNFGIAQYGPYIYVVGGLNGATKKNDVVYTQIASTGALTTPAGCGSTWCTAGNTFSTARQENQAVVYNGVLYVVGGYDGSNALGDVQYSVLGSDGSIGAFSYTTYQDRNARGRGVVAANGYIYFLGSENSALDVYYTAINANHTLGNQYRASTNGMPAASVHNHASYLSYNGFLYAVGGCNLTSNVCTTGASQVNNRVDYVGQKASARAAHYSKLFDTEVNTAPSQLQVNGTLASGGSGGAGGSVVTATMKTAQTGQALGVAQIFNPTILGDFYTMQALDSSGANVGIAFIYSIFITIDDSQSGTFPDTGSAVTDFTIYYHANPGRRLRHGASFTNTGCSGALGAAAGCILDTAP
jgi:hypothetical protein